MQFVATPGFDGVATFSIPGRLPRVNSGGGANVSAEGMRRVSAVEAQSARWRTTIDLPLTTLQRHSRRTATALLFCALQLTCEIDND